MAKILVAFKPRVHTSQPLGPILNQLNAVNTVTSYSLLSILTLSCKLDRGLLSGFVPQGIPAKTMYAVLISPMRATYPARLIFYDLMTLSEERRSWWPCGLRRGSSSVGCWDRGFESRSRHGCLTASFCVVLSCVDRGLATG
jgi:hypothetical protein